jgi:hypothetical protein
LQTFRNGAACAYDLQRKKTEKKLTFKARRRVWKSPVFVAEFLRGCFFRVWVRLWRSAGLFL